ncbi:tRNA-dihydrouridine(16/17) synthase [NAD(P)(+)]-like isoform X2 [Ischnura elegans]|uniref:tRNA-dihydrouridine(16/17) synthase [NAD(P)(+)]-like isoform X2 n=1 Tax=Ischnura elegans TaxID=197161 RepID=UPI001ED8A05B|nr:tRNA-dihydrouridine(16/17) synthase [NAD(P)(+)]-like isoform X2 [Ischnura elegans]
MHPPILHSDGKSSHDDSGIASEPEACSLPIQPRGSSPMDWWRHKLKCPRFVLAPMVDASELAWRLLARKHGADLTYSPMFHACLFAKDPIYRERAMQTCKEDSPFIVQFCSNDPEQFIEAGLLVQDHCDAVDLNLGCPQAIARRGRYGAFLQDDWSLIGRMVSMASKALSVPVTCKVRVFEDVERTVKYAQMLESAGAYALTVHGRTREQKGPATGKASWDHIKIVRQNVQVPVIANGNIECAEDVYNCFQQTGCHGVMTAEGSLHNPAVFHTSAVANCTSIENNHASSLNQAKRRDISLYRETAEKIRCSMNSDDKEKFFPEGWELGPPPPVWEPGLEYLEFVSEYPCPFSYIRGHLFKLFHHCLSLPVNYDLRANLAKSSTLEEFRKVVEDLRDRFLPYHLGKNEEGAEEAKKIEFHNPEDESKSSTPWPWHPPWLCQPYIRPTLAEQSQRLENRKMNAALEPKKDENTIDEADVTTNGLKCAFKLCRSCCKIKCNDDIVDCVAHRFMVKSKKLRWEKKEGTGEQKNEKENTEEVCTLSSAKDGLTSDVVMSEPLNCDNTSLSNDESTIELTPVS